MERPVLLSTEYQEHKVPSGFYQEAAVDLLEEMFIPFHKYIQTMTSLSYPPQILRINPYKYIVYYL
jgi:hypothetical protein